MATSEETNGNERELVNGLDVSQLTTIVGAVKAQPDLGKTMWRARTQWKGGFQSEAEIRGFKIQMDEPPDLAGTNTAPNMVEMVLGAYGCCLQTGYAMNAAVMGIEIQKMDIELEGDIDLPGFFGLESPDDVWPGFTTVRAKVFLKAPGATAGQLEELHRRVTSTSPVGSTLARPVKVETTLVTRRVA
ncbi:MAG: OsmC family protein [Ardenticatenaceae bacterium]|nr:OsmC family protein [Ardenticatenaceae bacterium]HBY96476.1 osmotically inducible protein C [Chloroflexota bacterium]